MFRYVLIFLCSLVTVWGQSRKPFCFVPYGPDSAPPLPKTTSQSPPLGPPGSNNNPCNRTAICETKTCPYGFEGNLPTCSCKCFDPCLNKRCDDGEVCIVMPAPDNLFYGYCRKKTDSCQKLFCGLPGCKFGYEVGPEGCETCECQDPCYNYGCPKGYTCQMLHSSSSSPPQVTLVPSCVACPKLDCPKVGSCPLGLAKGEDGCDVCECHGCPCIDDCRYLYCSDYNAMNETTGCNMCTCETVPCSGKCASDETCTKKYTKHGRIHGACEKSVKCPDCSSAKCPYGLETDSNGCHLQNCSCHNPCKRMSCNRNSYCAMTADDCTNKTDCRDGPMPYCKDCPILEQCSLECKQGRAKDANGCDLCTCLSCGDLSVSCPLICKYGRYSDPETGCEMCECMLSPCQGHTCNSNEKCRDEMFKNGTYYARCVVTVPVEPCQTVNCGDKRCLMGFEKDSQGCTLPSCSCFDWCKDYPCPAGEVCRITKDDCINKTDCRDVHLRYCEDISNISTTTSTTRCPVVTCGPGCVHSLDSNPCGRCDCTTTTPHVTNLGITTTTTTQPTIVCTMPWCSDLCRIASKPNLPCPVCECPPDCQNSTCPSDEICQMVYESEHCSAPPCPQIPKCVPRVSTTTSTTLCPMVTCGPGCTWYMKANGCADCNCTTTPINSSHSTTSTTICPQILCRPDCSWYATSDGCGACNCSLTTPRTTRCPVVTCGPGCVHSLDSNPCGRCDCTTTTPHVTNLGITTTTTTWPTIVCTMPWCSDLCRIAFKPNLPCPICECPPDCQNSTCPSDEICQMVYGSEHCSAPPCPQIPKCVPKRPLLCSLSMAVGERCIETPLIQYYFNSSTHTCQSFLFNGCLGNQNRFPSLASCISTCNLQTYDCTSNRFCQLNCSNGFKLESDRCPTCQCVDICDDVVCASPNQQCRVQTTSCPSDLVGRTFVSESVALPYCPNIEVPKCICKPTTCQVTCPFSKVKDSEGCDTCDCHDPCRALRCPSGNLCQVVEYQNCEDSSCSSAHSGVCMDAFLKRNFRMRLNASYEMYVMGSMESLKRQLTDQLSEKYRVRRDMVSITKFERGSIVAEGDVLYLTSREYRDTDNQNKFIIILDNETYPASVLVLGEERPSEDTRPLGHGPYLTQGEIILIILLCVLVPLAIIISIVVTYFTCIYCKKRKERESIKLINGKSPSESSETLEGNSKTFDNEKVWTSNSSIESEGKSVARPVSFTDA